MAVAYNVTEITTTIGDAMTLVIGSISSALSKIVTEGGLMFMLIMAVLAFTFIAWAIRLLHLRGR